MIHEKTQKYEKLVFSYRSSLLIKTLEKNYKIKNVSKTRMVKRISNKNSVEISSTSLILII